MLFCAGRLVLLFSRKRLFSVKRTWAISGFREWVAILTKESIRKEILRIRGGLDAKTLILKSHQIALNLFTVKEFEMSLHVLFYLALDREVQTQEMIEYSFAKGKKVYVPIVFKGTHDLGITELVGLNIGFQRGHYGVREPEEKYLNIVPAEVVDFVVAPGLAFDFKGGRIGYGGGYYDRLMMNLSPAVQRVAVAFDFQVFDLVPQGDSDVPMHKIVTEKEAIHCR